MIGGRAGLMLLDGCTKSGFITPDARLFDAVIIVDGRAYSFTMYGDVDRAYFLAFLATVTLDPGSARDPSPSPS